MTKENEIRKCEKCNKDFLIIKQEREFYTKKNLPFPSNCSECRRDRRRNLRNERKLYKRKCDKCGIELMSTYPESNKYIIYCEKCYWDNLGGADQK